MKSYSEFLTEKQISEINEILKELNFTKDHLYLFLTGWGVPLFLGIVLLFK